MGSIIFPEEECVLNNDKIENILTENVSQYMEKERYVNL